MPSFANQKEQDEVDMLLSMMGDAVTQDVALRVLRKHHGDLDKAATALLADDTGGPSDSIDTSWSGGLTVGPQTPPPSKPERDPPVIDLTADDEDKELSRALKASLEDHAPRFGPSERAPDPNWAMVPSNVATSGVDAQDENLSRAIAASLEDAPAQDCYEELPLEERVRKDGRPVALRPTHSPLAYAGLILHSLYYVPQVRHAVSQWCHSYLESQAPVDEGVPRFEVPIEGPDFLLWSLMEIFANMEIALISELNSDKVINAFNPEPWNSPVEHPGNPSFSFYCRLAHTVESSVQDEPPRDAQPEWSRLFHFRYGFSNEDLSKVPFDRRHDLSIVKVDVRGTEDSNDLVSCLSSELNLNGLEYNATKQQVIFEPSEVVAFQLVRENALPSYAESSGARKERTTFKYPKHVYLDQFLEKNLELGNLKRQRQQELQREIEEMMLKRAALTRHNDRDTLVDLRSSLHYYENVAEDAGDPSRKATLHEMALNLRKILTRIENDLQTIETSIERLRDESANVFEQPELQQYRYDLRVVLVHDGLYGRKHLYSYVKDKESWWKTQDSVVNKVSEETILHDPVGLHLGAGPYLLFYSRALTEEDEGIRAPWPEAVKNNVKHNNQMFLSQLPHDVANCVQDPNSPPSSPYHSQAPSEYTLSSGTAEPSLSRGELMDVDG